MSAYYADLPLGATLRDECPVPARGRSTGGRQQPGELDPVAPPAEEVTGAVPRLGSGDDFDNGHFGDYAGSLPLHIRCHAVSATPLRQATTSRCSCTLAKGHNTDHHCWCGVSWAHELENFRG